MVRYGQHGDYALVDDRNCAAENERDAHSRVQRRLTPI